MAKGDMRLLRSKQSKKFPPPVSCRVPTLSQKDAKLMRTTVLRDRFSRRPVSESEQLLVGSTERQCLCLPELKFSLQGIDLAL